MEWIAERVKTLHENERTVRSALVNAGVTEICGGEGAIYLFAKLPIPEEEQDDVQSTSSSPPGKKKKRVLEPMDAQIVERLVLEYGIAVIPGSACGLPGWIRVCFANLPKDTFVEASARLEKGLKEILLGGGVRKTSVVSDGVH